MLEKVAKILGKMNSTVWMAVALGIVVAVFVVGLVLSLGGDLGKFKKIAKQVIKNPDMNTCNATAKQLPTRVRKQYKVMKRTGAKPDDVITPDACVYSPFKESVAASFPNAVMAAGILSILLAFFVCGGALAKDAADNFAYLYVAPVIVTVVVMILRLAAGLISTMLLKSGVKAYNGYVNAIATAMDGGAVSESEQAESAQPAYAAHAYGNTFDQPDHITVELADDEPTTVAEPVVMAEPEPVQAETVVMQETQESEAELRARARAEAMAAARAEQAAAQAQAAAAAQAQAAHAQAQAAQAQAQAAAHAQAAAQAQAAAAAQAQAQAAHAQTAQGSSSADEVIARIEQIKTEGASLTQMKEIALQLQKERAKPENKTPEQQRRLNEALAVLLKSMSSATKK